MKKEISSVNEVIHQVSDELREHTHKQRSFRDLTLSQMEAVKDTAVQSLEATKSFTNFMKTSALIQACTAEHLKISSIA